MRPARAPSGRRAVAAPRKSFFGLRYSRKRMRRGGAMIQGVRQLVTLTMVLSSICPLIAAPLDKSLSDTHGRRKAAENGLRQIKAKSQEQADGVRALYTAAASNNNAWVDAVCQAI